MTSIQADTKMIYADETLRLACSSGSERETTLTNFLNTYAKCGFDFDNTENNFLPKTGFWFAGSDRSLEITDTAKSWDIYKLFTRYNDKGKLDNLTYLSAPNITVAGLNSDGLYGADNQPLASFPYKVNGQVIRFMNNVFKGFENMYEDGTNPIPDSTSTSRLNVKNFATKSQLANTQFYTDGAYFFQYAPPYIKSTGAVKFMQINSIVSVNSVKYLDLRDVPGLQARLIGKLLSDGEVAFNSPAATPFIIDARTALKYDIGYANDSYGVTKLIGMASEGFASYQASTRNNNIYGVLELQVWTDGVPPQDKTAAQLPSWTASEFNQQLTAQ